MEDLLKFRLLDPTPAFLILKIWVRAKEFTFLIGFQVLGNLYG
jgi:hypothetical protein